MLLLLLLSSTLRQISAAGFLLIFKLKLMTFEDAQDMWNLYQISPELTCTCDELHTCQQCMEDITEGDYHNTPEENPE
jgi:hypothetical protein